jgi:hypothetical protein
MRPLDFVVIGASKSGTTSLFEYLRAHPRIALPKDKDFPFFRSAEMRAAGWDRSAAAHFGDVADDALLGTITPSYLEDRRVAPRLAEAMPATLLVAILRNPIDRAFSQYRQQIRLDRERRSFADTIRRERSDGPPPDGALVTEDGTRTLLPQGEYGRMLGLYLEHFPRKQLLVQFTEDLERDPGAVLDAVLAHLGLPAGFRPGNLGQRYHQGGSRQRFPGLLPTLRALPGLRAVWHLLPRHRRRNVWRRFFAAVNVVPEEAPELAPELRAELADFYREDVRALEAIVERAVPWPDFDRGVEPRIHPSDARPAAISH